MMVDAFVEAPRSTAGSADSRRVVHAVLDNACDRDRPLGSGLDVGFEPDHAADDEQPLPPATRRLPVQRGEAGRLSAVEETVIEEVPVALVCNGISQAVMLATPQDLEDFALGFLLGEGMVASPRDVYEIDVVPHVHGIEVRLRIAAGAMQALRQARRMRTGKTGCGLCGLESLAQFQAGAGVAPMPAQQDAPLRASAVHTAIDGLLAFQPLHAATGAAHAAGWASRDGAVQLVREDVGRHNALDKLIGAMARRGIAPQAGFAAITSRASFEMVQKAARARIAVLAAVSAPTAMAVRMAQDTGLTLAGFVRGQRHVVYSHGHRIVT